MRDAVIVDAVRTPVGRRNGAYKDTHPVDLSAHVLNALVERTGIDPVVVDDVVWGCVMQVGEQAVNVGQYAVLADVGLEADEGVRRDTTVEKLASLKPAFKEDGVIHAGNSSQISDGSGALLITTSEKARELGLKPIARLHTFAVAGDDPIMMP